jgi:dolichol-phosphate mannosyltransferase
MNQSRPLISVVSPVYLGERLVEPLVQRLREQIAPISEDFEIILVEDGSPDSSWTAIERVSGHEPRVRGIKLSRNFGQHRAITAGLDHTRGEWVVVMDCDLQDRPEEIPALYQRAQDGYDVVLARRALRQDNAFKRVSSAMFYRVLSYLTGVEQDPLVANFGMYSQRVIRVLTEDMRENIRFFPMMVRWLGFNVTSIEVTHGESARGQSSYTLGKLLDLAFNIMLTFSDKPLRLTVRLGLIITAAAFVYGLYAIYQMLNGKIEVMGWTSIIVSVWFLAGFIIFVLGVIGLYLGRTFEEVKGRPIYVVQQTTDADDEISS